ncbi:hypothetical protein [Erythrobacter sp. JK5]|uniref:hypothetical protein n=1 Tax=Erythrobacter sp. JK5 TaxID=2829500 RepID=UPI001BA568C1|nr:hypothetical protein [Erythrobacter sp. JK5]QUL38934.1 hypothetical protein KDC96_06165 [Erythrobacter sp. JK5]
MTNEVALVIVAAIGVIGTLAASFVSPFYQRAHEKWKAEREDQAILRDKAEELFDEIDSYVSGYQQASVSAVARLKDETVEVRGIPDLARIRSITAIYFPSAMPLVEDFEKQNRVLMTAIVEQAKTATEQGAAGLDTLKGLPMIMTVKYQQLASEFIPKLRGHIATETPKLGLETKK